MQACSGRVSPAGRQKSGSLVARQPAGFEPQTLEVPASSGVTGKNTDEELHAIVAGDGSFASKGLDTDEPFTRTFAAPGTYAYHCAHERDAAGSDPVADPAHE